MIMLLNKVLISYKLILFTSDNFNYIKGWCSLTKQLMCIYVRRA